MCVDRGPSGVRRVRAGYGPGVLRLSSSCPRRPRQGWVQWPLSTDTDPGHGPRRHRRVGRGTTTTVSPRQYLWGVRVGAAGRRERVAAPTSPVRRTRLQTSGTVWDVHLRRRRSEWDGHRCSPTPETGPGPPVTQRTPTTFLNGVRIPGVLCLRVSKRGAGPPVFGSASIPVPRPSRHGNTEMPCPKRRGKCRRSSTSQGPEPREGGRTFGCHVTEV